MDLFKVSFLVFLVFASVISTLGFCLDKDRDRHRPCHHDRWDHDDWYDKDHWKKHNNKGRYHWDDDCWDHNRKDWWDRDYHRNRNSKCRSWC
ncbi:hypothetical protein FQR65_LT11448 [Abscondita terminalis]|nr:hypothetical protein FQR65_LT11448 [Abscondita terminalis]